ncbi:MAG: UvrD-helicase domain-containing protein [Roseburia sp.]|nr:UvrD-helicase domain-containing protein [Roseburia sp.]
MNPDYLNELNPQQRDAVVYTDGPSLVIAGAGSGKTRVLTYKIVHLLNQGFEPWRILALTFTNKAAREMRERIQALVDPAVASKLRMGTFHSVFARILRANAEKIGFNQNFTIYDSADSKSLVKLIIKDMGLDDKIYKPSTVLSAISTAKNALISPEQYAASPDIMEADRNSHRPELHEIYRTYRDRCFAAGAMDFDDLLYYTNLLLRDNPETLQLYQEYFRYVLVDEYQDTNFAQHVIVTQLCRNHHKLCVVGDDAQSIYSFRGANIRNILNLNKAYPELRTFKLERNYRSTQNIINAANSLIDKNTEGIKKQVYSENEPGQRVEVVQSYSDFEEGYMLAGRIKQRKMRTADSYDDFAVLYRTNAQSRRIEESLRNRNIPYRIYGGLSFYQRKEVKDAVAYFRLSVNPADDEALRRIINFPARGIGETTLGKLTHAAMTAGVSIMTVLDNPAAYGASINAGTTKKLTAFREMITLFAAMNQQGENASEVVRKIISETGLLSMLVTERTPESISKQENLQELIRAADEFVEMREETGDKNISLVDFLSVVSLATDQDSDDASDERVTLMTVHAAKGLEFNNVYIIGVEDDRFPSSMAGNSLSEIEEERRLLYVAITRARNFCMLSYAATGMRNGQPAACAPSRFLRDIDPDLLKIDSGAKDFSGSLRVSPTTGRSSYGSSYYAPASLHKQSPTLQPSSSSPDQTRFRSVNSAIASAAPRKTTSIDGARTHTVDELAIGMHICHQRFGQGEIISIDTSGAEPKIVVDFGDGSQRALLLKFAIFKISS